MVWQSSVTHLPLHSVDELLLHFQRVFGILFFSQFSTVTISRNFHSYSLMLLIILEVWGQTKDATNRAEYKLCPHSNKLSLTSILHILVNFVFKTHDKLLCSLHVSLFILHVTGSLLQNCTLANRKYDSKYISFCQLSTIIIVTADHLHIMFHFQTCSENQQVMKV